MSTEPEETTVGASDLSDMLGGNAWIDAENVSAIHQREGSRWVKIIAQIRKNSTGEVRDYPTYAIIEDGEESPDTYIWEDGNFSCDCNRRLFFLRANNDEEPDDEDCGDTAFSVRLLNAKDRACYYSELDA